MAFVLKDRVKESTTTVGTGAIALAGASVGFQSFSAAIGNTNNTYYTIAGQGSNMFIKASGGIRTIDDIKKFYPFVDRFGVGYAAVDTMNGIGGNTKNNY